MKIQKNYKQINWCNRENSLNRTRNNRKNENNNNLLIQQVRKNNKRDEFWEHLNYTIKDSKDKLLIIEDINIRVAKMTKRVATRWKIKEKIVRNTNWIRQINFCAPNELLITNTFHQHENTYKRSKKQKRKINY